MANFWIKRQSEKLAKKIDVGYFYSPYITVLAGPVNLDPETFRSYKGILTRYGKKKELR